MHKVKTESFDLEVIRSLDKMSYAESLSIAIKMIDESKMKEPKKVRLKDSISKARTAERVCVAMWQSYLAGEGLSSMSSNWNNR